MGDKPSGLVAFLMTDIEGSTALWQGHREAMAQDLEVHDRLMRRAFVAWGGHVFATGGDSFAVAFSRVSDALGAAVEVQRSLSSATWRAPGGIRVRIGLHVGECYERDGDYFGPTLNLCARVMALGHGGQILATDPVRRLGDSAELAFVDLGEHRLRDHLSAERILQVDAPGLISGFPPLASQAISKGNIPALVSSLVGRRSELGRVMAELADKRLVTIVGAGGMGKTRLAQEVAFEVAEAFSDGAWFVELAPLRSGDAIEAALANALNLRVVPGRTISETLEEFLTDRLLLIVLDNCEHVIDEAATVAERLLRRAPGLRLLATSRAPLRLDGEQIVDLSGLDVEDAIDLFIERATRARAGRVFDGKELSAIRQIVLRLDTMPLAIELAAARARTQPVGEILTSLDRRFDVLRSRERLRPERQRTLAATVEWSHDRLAPDVASFFDQLALFAGSFDVGAAAAVVDVDVPAGEALDELVEQSLLTARPEADAARFRLLETMRQFGRERLAARGLLEAGRRRHLVAYVARAEQIRHGFEGPDDAPWYRRLSADMDNLREAFEFAMATGNTDAAIRIVAAVGEFAMFRLETEIFGWADRVADLPGLTSHPKWAQALAAASVGEWHRGRLDHACQLAGRGLAVDTGVDPQGTMSLLAAAFSCEWFRGEPRRAISYADRGLHLARATKNRFRESYFLAVRAMAENSLALPTAHDSAAEALAVARALGNGAAESGALLILGTLAMHGDPRRGAELFERLLLVANETGCPWYVYNAQRIYAIALHRAGQRQRAAQAFLDAIDGFELSGESSQVWIVILNAASMLIDLGRYHDVATIIAAYDQQPSAPREQSAYRMLQRLRAVLDQSLSADDLAAASLEVPALSRPAMLDSIRRMLREIIEGAEPQIRSRA